MVRYTADWILPVTGAPIRRGWVAIEGGRIVAVGSEAPGDAADLGRAVILPALVNVHTHLELSYLRGRVPAASCFTDWIRAVMAARRDHPDPTDAEIVGAASRAIDEACAAGTGLLGDVSNTLVTVPLLVETGVRARVFYELLGFKTDDPEARVREARATIARAGADGRRVRISLAPHAPYSVAPGLFRALRAELDRDPEPISSVHLAESIDELELLRSGTGPLRALLEDVGAWDPHWRPPGLSPVAYLSELGFLDGTVVAVHGVQFDGSDLSRLRALGATVAACPRSNRHVGVGAPPLEACYAMNVAVAFGTDSLASAPDLDVFAELAEARRLAPRVPARKLIESATLAGAKALGFGDELGSVEAGKAAALIAVRVQEGVVDVEEYLVGGIKPAAVMWLDRG
jgi:cytosine/adenosine deaminase-related metal-dependent hydrolase